MSSDLVIVALLFVLTLAVGLWQELAPPPPPANAARQAGREPATPRPALASVLQGVESLPPARDEPSRQHVLVETAVETDRVTITRAEYELLRAAGELVAELAAERRREEQVLELISRARR